MNPLAMTIVLVCLLGLFAYSAQRRWGLLQVGSKTHESRFDQLGQRLKALGVFVLYHKKMRYYPIAGVAHHLIFLGFSALLLRTLVLVGRGYSPSFNLWVLTPGTALGDFYGFVKDVMSVLVLAGVSVFIYFRTIKPQKRMALHWEGLLILGIIAVMMVADVTYDAAAIVLSSRVDTCSGELCGAIATVTAPYVKVTEVAFHPYPEPAASALALAFVGLGDGTLFSLAHAGFWTHATLVFVFLNILPYSKHFHILTVLNNVFSFDLTPKGRLRPIAKSTEELMTLVEKASEAEDPASVPIGYARIEHFTWKDILDFYTCTECGRCSDNCPAATTGKILSPKHFTLDLRDHLYSRQAEFLALGDSLPRVDLDELLAKAKAEAEGAEPAGAETKADAAESAYKPVDLVPNVIHEDVLWACTSCGACEEQCPVMITYVDKIVQMRRHLVTIKGEFPAELNKPFSGMETNGNPWNLSRMDRANWAEGLDIPTLAENPKAELVYFVGCAASYDDRAKKIARATALLLKQAKIDFAILAEEETCTGDPARRAGNEFLFMSLAETNVATLNGYQEQGGVKTILTTCPHGYNTLANEYSDFGGKYQVVHHTDYLMSLVAEKKLVPTERLESRIVYHDSCYLGRYNGIYDSPRELLKAIPGVELVEPEGWSRNKAMCCGAGGAQMWMEEQNKDRVNVKRTKQLLGTGATTIATACPYCMTMLTDGIKDQEREADVDNLDVVELLAAACIKPGAEASAG